MTVHRAISINELCMKKLKIIPFEDNWLRSFGEPERSGAWIIWGNSGNGKTYFALQLCKYLTKFGRIAYNSLEEGCSQSMKLAFIKINMIEVRRKLILLDREPINELKERLKRRQSPNIIAIDTIQYSGMNYKDYKELRYDFPKKLFILISHAEGKEPAGRVAKSIKFDASVKIRCEGYKAFPVSRSGGSEPFIIWNEGAGKYWG